MERLASSLGLNPCIHGVFADMNDRHVHVGSEPTGAAEGFQTASTGGAPGG